MEIFESTRAHLSRIRTEPTVVDDRPAVFAVEGPGAVDCLQGLLTNDVVTPGVGSLVYGALLTPKGAIIADCWSLRLPEGFLLIVGAVGRERTAELLRRQLPPRLARVTDRSEALAALWLLGPRPLRPSPLGDALPTPGRATHVDRQGTRWYLATGGAVAPFTGLLVLPEADRAAAWAELEAAGAARGAPTDLRIARVLAGAPTLGSEIDERTFPQEADFDRLEGVSYAKGCYVGQETVARIHFRGHPNWLLRGIRAGGDWTPVGSIESAGKVIARVGTLVRTEGGEVVGLATVRREIEPGAELSTNGSVRVTTLPPPFP
jgi:folate-binding protein YgfZ